MFSEQPSWKAEKADAGHSCFIILLTGTTAAHLLYQWIGGIYGEYDPS
jgi:hypothetical protein